MSTSNTDLRLRQEKVNSLLHSLGILFGLVCIPILLSMAQSPDRIIGAAIYGISFLMVFTFSTLYHGFQREKLKKTFKILDHISIYFLIAGTYTPLLLIYHNNGFGMRLLVVLWCLTLLGTVFKIYCCGKWETASTIIYLLMGWSMFSGGWSFFSQMPQDVLVLVLAGGALYTIGVIFYVWEKFIYSHAVWHSFVLAAAICHYAAIHISVA